MKEANTSAQALCASALAVNPKRSELMKVIRKQLGKTSERTDR